MKNANSGNLETVNFVQIRRFLTVLLQFSQKNLVIFGTTLETTFFARIATKPSKIVDLYLMGGFEIAGRCDFQNSKFSSSGEKWFHCNIIG